MSKPADVPFETTHRVRDACLCLHAQRAARLFDEALRPVGLTSGPIWERTHEQAERLATRTDIDALRAGLRAPS